MKIRCINNAYVEQNLELGKVYESNKLEDDCYLILGVPNLWYHKDRFEVLDNTEENYNTLAGEYKKVKVFIFTENQVINILTNYLKLKNEITNDTLIDNSLIDNIVLRFSPEGDK